MRFEPLVRPFGSSACPPTQRESGFAADVRAGLTAQPKKLQPKYFYDELGSQLFEAICHLPEYYLTKCETEILWRNADRMVSCLPGPVTVVELGSGSSVKTRYVLEALLARQGYLLYQPIDISETILAQSARSLLRDYPSLQINAQARDYTRGLGAIKRADNESVLVLCLGSNIGNYDPEEARELLLQVRRSLRAGDGLLLGADLKKSPAILESAYNDALGVTAAFNLNLLLQINRKLQADFDLKKFKHHAFYNQELGRIEMHLVSRVAQIIRIKDLGLTIKMHEGETIHTENSWKFDFDQLTKLATDTGFKVSQVWLDAEAKFSCSLWLRL